jgi:hypothetical protein
MTHKHPQKFFGFLLLGSFLLLICVEGFHHHQDRISHTDCPLCVAAQQTAIVSHHISSLIVSQDVQVVPRDSVPELISLKDRRPSFVRGPPA